MLFFLPLTSKKYSLQQSYEHTQFHTLISHQLTMRTISLSHEFTNDAIFIMHQSQLDTLVGCEIGFVPRTYCIPLVLKLTTLDDIAFHFN